MENTATAEPKSAPETPAAPLTWQIPEERHAEIKALIREKELCRFRLLANSAAVHNLINADKPEEAYERAAQEKGLQEAGETANTILWDTIHDALPELPREGNYTLNSETLEVVKGHRGGNGVGIFAGIGKVMGVD